MASTENNDPAEIVHRIRGANGQTADLLVVEQYDGTDVFKVDKDGVISGSYTTPYDPDAQSYIVWKSGSTYYAKSGADGSIISTNADAGVVINAALTAANAAGGGRVEMTAGTFTLTTGITMPALTELVGAGRTKTTLLCAAAIDAITFGSGIELRCRLAGMTIDGDETGTRGFVASRKYMIFMRDVWITDFTSHGIDAVDAVAWQLNDVRTYSNGGWGARFTQSATTATTVNLINFWSNGDATGGCYSVAHGASFRECVFEQVPIGLQLSGVIAATVDSCWFEADTDKGLYLDGSTANYAIRVKGCTFASCNYPIYATGTNYNMEIGPGALINCTYNHYFGQYATMHRLPDSVSGTTPVNVTDLNRSWYTNELVQGETWAIRAVKYYDEFMGDSLDARWSSTGTVAPLSSYDNGWVRFTTGALVNDTASLYWGSMRASTLSRSPRIAWKGGIPATYSSTELAFGLTDGGYSSSNTGVWFEYIASTDTNWYAVSCNGSTKTRTDTGVAVGAGYKTFEMVASGATAVYFYIDGVLVATNTTNLPDSGDKMEPWFEIKTTTTAARYWDMDFVLLIQSRI